MFSYITGAKLTSDFNWCRMILGCQLKETQKQVNLLGLTNYGLLKIGMMVSSIIKIGFSFIIHLLLILYIKDMFYEVMPYGRLLQVLQFQKVQLYTILMGILEMMFLVIYNLLPKKNMINYIII